MTTRVKIENVSIANEHAQHLVSVDVVQGEHRAEAHVLHDGQSVEITLYGEREIKVTEIA